MHIQSNLIKFILREKQTFNEDIMLSNLVDKRKVKLQVQAVQRGQGMVISEHRQARGCF